MRFFGLILFLLCNLSLNAENLKIKAEKAISKSNLKVRIKDIANFSGIRNNQLVGYGLVVGLNGTGDTLSNSPYTKESLTSMLERLGVNIRDNSLPSGKNVAAVMVTSNLPPFAHTGTTIDVVVSALGDAKDLNGGTLLVTPLIAADGEVYAVAQGEVLPSGVSVIGTAASQITGLPTTAKIPNGAIVEKEIVFQLTDLKSQTLNLRSPDLTTAKRVAEAINTHFERPVASAKDSAGIHVELPKGSSEKIIEAMTQIEQLEIEPDQVARVIIDPAGVIVLGSKVRISPVALTHGSISVRITESAAVSQPNPFTQVVNPSMPALTPTANTQQPGAPTLVPTVAQAPTQPVANNGVPITATIPQNTTPTQLRDALYSLPANATTATIAATISSIAGNGVPGGPAAVSVIPTGVPPTQIAAALVAFPATATPQQMALAINAIPSPAAQTTTAPSTQPSQQTAPSPLTTAVLNSSPQTAIIPETQVKLDEQKNKFVVLDTGVDLEELVKALSLLGTTPRETAQILQGVKAAGALHADIRVS
ncbi:MAG: flagellar basal body P-ring protein FlgI [Pseudomonadota bacterium]|jgi:flagellar P-ring protein precursor FlgI|nr:flagellar basal body P-ring protein FlgI [Alphaproteobacteria bacterium]